jgi:hypothetical protein
MALSTTELDLEATEYLPARDVMTSLPQLGLPKTDSGNLLGMGKVTRGVVALYKDGILTDLGK